MDDGDTKIAICQVQLPNGNQFEGRGTNKKLAKADACRKAMKWQQENTHEIIQSGGSLCS